MNRFTPLVFILFFLKMATAQEENSSFLVGIRGGYGFIIPHSPTMGYIANRHINRLEVSLEKRTFGESHWHQLYNYPRIGLSFSKFNLNNPQHLGQGYALAPHMNFGLIEGKLAQLRLRTGLGISFIEKTFDTEKNYKNVAIGSKLNIFVSIMLTTEFKISRSASLSIGTNLSHFSNTAFKKPNLGINVPTAEIGLSYDVGKRKEQQEKELEKLQDINAEWVIGLGTGLNELYPPNGVKYLATILNLSREKQLNHKSSIGGGLDLFYNPAQRVALKVDSVFIDKGWDNLQAGVSFYHVLHFGKLGALARVGYYFKTKNEELGNFYHMVQGNIKISEQWNTHFAIKTHYLVAEYFLIGFSRRIK